MQSRGGAVTAADTLPFAIRAGNAFASYFRYLGKMVIPVDLCVFYPHPGLSFPLWKGGVAAVLVLALTALAVQQVKRRPYFLAGWLWYLGTLIPVLGFVQAGGQSMADRYTYIPLIGVFIILAWGAAELVTARSGLRLPVIVTASAAMLAFCALTVRQVEFWKDSVTLFTHAVSVTGANWMAEQNLGFAYGRLGNHAQAIPHYDAALRMRPILPEVHRALGISLAAVGRPEDAFRNYEEALRMDPDYAEGHYDYAVSLAAQGRLEDAVRHYSAAIRLQPDYPQAYNNLGVALAMLGRTGRRPRRAHPRPGAEPARSQRAQQSRESRRHPGAHGRGDGALARGASPRSRQRRGASQPTGCGGWPLRGSARMRIGSSFSTTSSSGRPDWRG